MLDVVQNDATDPRMLEQGLFPDPRQVADVEDLDVSHEALPEAELLVFEVVDHELLELEPFEDLLELLRGLEALSLEAVEDI